MGSYGIVELGSFNLCFFSRPLGVPALQLLGLLGEAFWRFDKDGSGGTWCVEEAKPGTGRRLGRRGGVEDPAAWPP